MSFYYHLTVEYTTSRGTSQRPLSLLVWLAYHWLLVLRDRFLIKRNQSDKHIVRGFISWVIKSHWSFIVYYHGNFWKFKEIVFNCFGQRKFRRIVYDASSKAKLIWLYNTKNFHRRDADILILCILLAMQQKHFFRDNHQISPWYSQRSYFYLKTVCVQTNSICLISRKILFVSVDILILTVFESNLVKISHLSNTLFVIFKFVFLNLDELTVVVHQIITLQLKLFSIKFLSFWPFLEACVHNFLRNFSFSPYGRPSKTMKNVFYFI